MNFHNDLSGLSVVTMVHGERRETKRIDYFVNTLLNQSICPDQLILVDTTVEPLVTEYIAGLEKRGVTYIWKPRQEFNHAWALNTGAKFGVSRFIMTADIDMMFDPRFLVRVLARLASNNNRLVLAVCGRLPDTDYTNLSMKDLSNSVDKLKLQHMYSPGAIQVSETSWFFKVHGYDEKYILDGWDVDMIDRAGTDGLEISWIEFEEAQCYHQWHEPSPLKGIGGEKFLENKEVLRNLDGWGE